MDRFDKIAGMVRIAAIADRIAAGKWESPRGNRRTWRRKTDEGNWEYREEKPKEEAVSEKKDVPGKKTMVTKRESVGEGVYKVGSGKEFKEILERNKKGNPFGASVEIKDKYPDTWKMMASEDESATVAVTDEGNIVSVSKSSQSKEKGWAMRAVSMAVKQGGKMLDCFETMLPDSYAKAGMKAVARLKFDEKYAPEGWNYDLYKKFNKGKPDIIFMVYSGEKKKYDGDVPEVDSYEKGVEMQKKLLEKGKKKQSSESSERGEMERLIDLAAKSASKRLGWSYEDAKKEIESY